MFCTKCGVQLPNGAKFCTNCGQKVFVLNPANPAKQKQPQKPILWISSFVLGVLFFGLSGSAIVSERFAVFAFLLSAVFFTYGIYSVLQLNRRKKSEFIKFANQQTSKNHNSPSNLNTPEIIAPQGKNQAFTQESANVQIKLRNEALRYPAKAVFPDVVPFDSFPEYLSDIPRFRIEVSDPIPKKSLRSMAEIKYSNITVRSRIDKLFPFVVIDTETTGLSPERNEIIEISAIRYEEGFRPVSCFTTLLCSSAPIPSSASAVNGITDSMVADCPYFSQIVTSLSEYVSGCNVVGHNLPFDLKFLYCNGLELSASVRYYDTLRISRNTLAHKGDVEWSDELEEEVEIENYDVENYKLGTLCQYYGIDPGTAHRSLSDCYATGRLFENLVNTRTAKYP